MTYLSTQVSPPQAARADCESSVYSGACVSSFKSIYRIQFWNNFIRDIQLCVDKMLEKQALPCPSLSVSVGGMSYELYTTRERCNFILGPTHQPTLLLIPHTMTHMHTKNIHLGVHINHNNNAGGLVLKGPTRNPCVYIYA